MGVVENIDFDKFPKQQEAWIGALVRVTFRYGTKYMRGEIVRADIEVPGVTIIRLSDGRHVLDTECQYSVPLMSEEPSEFPLGTDLSHFDIPLSTEESMWIETIAESLWEKGPYLDNRIWEDGSYFEDIIKGLELAFKRGKKIGQEEKP